MSVAFHPCRNAVALPTAHATDRSPMWLNEGPAQSPSPDAAGSDSDLDALAELLKPLDNSDDDIDNVISAALPLPVERYARRGHLLAAFMRERKKSRGLQRGGNVAAHTQSLIDISNEDLAKSEEQVISINARRPVKIRGRGAYKCWLPEALQRACWGLRPRPRQNKKPRNRITRKGKLKTRAAVPTTMSARACAILSRSSSKYVQEIRNAVAERFLLEQQGRLKALRPGYDTVFLEVAFDETEEPVSLNSVRSEIVSIMTLHLRFFGRRGGGTEKFDVVLPPAAVATTAAEHLKGALMSRLPLPLAAFRNLAGRFALIVNRLRRFLPPSRSALHHDRPHAFCAMPHASRRSRRSSRLGGGSSRSSSSSSSSSSSGSSSGSSSSHSQSHSHSLSHSRFIVMV